MKSRSELKRNGVIASMDVWRTYGETIEEMAAAVCYPNEIDPIVMGEIILGGDAVEVTATVLKIDEQRVKNLVANMLDPLWSKVYKRLIFPLEIAYADSDEEPEEKDGRRCRSRLADQGSRTHGASLPAIARLLSAGRHQFQ